MASTQVNFRDSLVSQFGEDLDRIYEEQEKKLGMRLSKKITSSSLTAERKGVSQQHEYAVEAGITEKRKLQKDRSKTFINTPV